MTFTGLQIFTFINVFLGVLSFCQHKDHKSSQILHIAPLRYLKNLIALYIISWVKALITEKVKLTSTLRSATLMFLQTSSFCSVSFGGREEVQRQEEKFLH